MRAVTEEMEFPEWVSGHLRNLAYAERHLSRDLQSRLAEQRENDLRARMHEWVRLPERQAAIRAEVWAKYEMIRADFEKRWEERREQVGLRGPVFHAAAHEDDQMQEPVCMSCNALWEDGGSDPDDSSEASLELGSSNPLFEESPDDDHEDEGGWAEGKAYECDELLVNSAKLCDLLKMKLAAREGVAAHGQAISAASKGFGLKRVVAHAARHKPIPHRWGCLPPLRFIWDPGGSIIGGISWKSDLRLFVS
jgi:hypothetical protein